ncbi:MAG: hypothetical protein DSY50_03445 [Desulfobulbus sp.]|nr:MAG: hypothetical protein DSY50_03445 [Desulfobulbus sp.]
MKTCWLNRQGHALCIVFMAGWGMGPEPFAHIPPGQHDLLLVYDYREIECRSLEKSLSDNTYHRILLLAWSMGVWVAGTLWDPGSLPFDDATAIGGTCSPVDDKSGIPPDIFDSMINDFTETSLQDFYTAMFTSPPETERFMANRPDSPLSELKRELVNLRNTCTQRATAADIFKRHIVTGRDRIFPARNQIRAWGKNNYEVFSWSHFPFYDKKCWLKLLNL